MQAIPRILIVDDEPELRQILLQFSQMLGFEGDACEDGEEALACIGTKDYDVILSDLVMPKLDGLGLLLELNRCSWRKPFILLTGHGSQELARQALQLGAYDFVEKPFDHKHLKSVLQGAVKLSRELVHSAQASLGKNSESSWGSQPIDFTNIILTSDTSQEAKQRFLDQSIDTLTFCKAAVKNLADTEARKFELGFLLRVMREISQKAQQCGFFDLSAFTSLTTESLIYYRAQPEALGEAQIRLFTDAILLLLSYLKVTDNKDSIQSLFFSFGEKMDILCQSFGVPSDNTRV